MMKNKKLIKISLLFVFLCAIATTSYFSIATYSKFVSQLDNATANKTIAKWEVSTDTSDNDSDTLNMVIGNTTSSYKLKVISTSEVKANYSIVLTNVPNDVEVKLDPTGTYTQPTSNRIEFNNVGSINANADLSDQVVEHTLYFNVPIDSNAISNSNIGIDVIFVQENPAN